MLAGTHGAEAVYWQHVGTQLARGLPGYSFVAATTSDSMAGSNPYTALHGHGRGGGRRSPAGCPPPTPATRWTTSRPRCPRPSPARTRTAPPTCSGARAPPPTSPSSASTAATVRTSCPRAGTSSSRRPPPATWTPPARPSTTSSAPWTSTATRARSPRCCRSARWTCPARRCPASWRSPRRAQPAARLDRPAARPAARGRGLARRLRPAGPPRAHRCSRATQPAGEHAVVWDGRDDAGRPVASGIYFVRCAAEGRTFTRRIAALR